MTIDRPRSRALGFAVAVAMAASPAAGGSLPLERECSIGKMVTATSTFYVDANENGVWDGVAGGDWSVAINAAAGPGTLFVGDWNGDGFDDPGKLVGTTFSVDLNGNHRWEGNAGGDRAKSFGAGFGAGAPLVGDWDADGQDELGTDISSTVPHFLLDLDGNGAYTGSPQDAQFVFAFVLPVGGRTVSGDWNGDGADDLGGYSGTTFAVDLNGNRVWNSNQGGDRKRSFAAFAGPGTPIIGDWDGDGSKQIGVYISTSGRFLLDLNANGRWDGNQGGDLNVGFASFAGFGTPLICDWNSDGTDDLGLVVGTQYYLDLTGDRQWNGNGGGDRVTDFAVGGAGTPVAGAWLPTR